CSGAIATSWLVAGVAWVDAGYFPSNGLVAEGVMDERLVVPLIHHIQKLTERVDELESELKLLSVSRSDIG
ncbi:hypothetical protein O5824_26970, partial [Escherichia coli]|nr:hypothetical protein [Escherichia coli]